MTNADPGWFIAVDGGGSKIAIGAAPIGSSASPEVRSWNFGGTGSAHPSTWATAADNLCRALTEVANDLQSHGYRIAAVTLALAGAGRTEDQVRVIQTVRTNCPVLADAAVACCGDIEPLIDYRPEDAQSIAVILGTGSCVASRNGALDMIRAGGWGPMLGDACSGGAIGLSALRYLTQLIDEGQTHEQSSTLAQAIASELQHLYGSNPATLNTLLIQTASDRTQTAKLASVVLTHAYQHGDRTATELMEPHLADIVWQIRQVARRCGVNDQALRLNFAGGVAEHHPPLRLAIQEACRAAGLNVIAEEIVHPIQAMLTQAHNVERAS